MKNMRDYGKAIGIYSSRLFRKTAQHDKQNVVFVGTQNPKPLYSSVKFINNLHSCPDRGLILPRTTITFGCEILPGASLLSRV